MKNRYVSVRDEKTGKVTLKTEEEPPCKHKIVILKSKDLEHGFDCFILCTKCVKVVGRMNFDDPFFEPKDRWTLLEKLKNAIEMKEKEAASIMWYRKKTFYNKYIGSAAWRKKRIQVILRCNNICEICQENEVEHVHHNNYDNVGNEDINDLVGMCKNCHSMYHGRKLI